MILKAVLALSLSAALALSLSITVFLSSAAFASAPSATNGFLLSMQLSMNGKLVSSPRVAVKEGESASISQAARAESGEAPKDATFVEVVATERVVGSGAVTAAAGGGSLPVATSEKTTTTAPDAAISAVEKQSTARPATSSSQPAILMKFVIGTVNAKGEKTILATPQIIALENEKAQITVANAPGQEDFSLSVIASRKQF